MTPPSTATAFGAPYVTRFLRRQQEALREGREPERFLHLGHWDVGAVGGDLDPAADDIARAQARLTEELLAMAALTDGLAVLEVGCGAAGTLARVRELHPRSQLAGLDVEPGQIELARRLVPSPVSGSLELRVGDACAMPYGERRFDRVFAVECGFHFASRARFLSEAARVLRPGGRLVSSDIVPTDALRAKRGDTSWLAGRARDRLQAGLGPWPDFWGVEPPLEVLAERAGLDVVELRDATASTLPSYASFVAPPDAERAAPERAAPERDRAPIDESVALLGWLQREGYLRVVYLAADRPL